MMFNPIDQINPILCGGVDKKNFLGAFLLLTRPPKAPIPARGLVVYTRFIESFPFKNV